MTPEEFKRIAKPKRSKYRNVRCEYKGMKFDSKLELQRYQFLENLQTEGTIKELRRQVAFPLEIWGTLIATYRADHTYRLVGERYPSRHGGHFPCEVEDVKGGIMTAEFRLKRKMFEAQYMTPIRIVTKNNVTEIPT